MELIQHLLPNTQYLRLEELHLDTANAQLQVTLSATQITAPCPICKGLSSRVHSHYERTLQDLTLAVSA